MSFYKQIQERMYLIGGILENNTKISRCQFLVEEEKFLKSLLDGICIAREFDIEGQIDWDEEKPGGIEGHKES